MARKTIKAAQAEHAAQHRAQVSARVAALSAIAPQLRALQDAAGKALAGAVARDSKARAAIPDGWTADSWQARNAPALPAINARALKMPYAHVAAYRAWQRENPKLARLESALTRRDNARDALRAVREAERLAASVKATYPAGYYPDAPIVRSVRRDTTYDIPAFFTLTPKG